MISLRGLLDRLGELDRVRVGAALADRLVDRDLERRGALVAGQLLEQLAELLLLGEHLVVRRAAAKLGAAVDAEQPAMARLEPRALAQAIKRVNVDRERERARDLHRVQQPAELGRVRQRRDVQRLLEVAVDAQVALVGPVDARGGDESRAARARRELRRARRRPRRARRRPPSRSSRAPGRRSGVRSAVVGLKRRQSRSSTSGPESRCVERSSASRSPRIESVRCSDSRATRRCEASERSSDALPSRRRAPGTSSRQSRRTAWSGR